MARFLKQCKVGLRWIDGSVQKHLSSSLQPIWFDLQTKQNITGQFYSGCRDWSLEKGRLLEQIGGKGEVAIIDGTAVSAVIERVLGCEAALKEFPDIKVVAKVAGDNAIGKGQTIATDILTANPNLKGIFGINDPTALGALLAAQDAKFTDLIIVGVDGAPSAVEELSKASSMFKGSASQDPRAMVKAVLAAVQDVMAGGNWPAEGILLPSEFITKDNLSTYKGWS